MIVALGNTGCVTLPEMTSAKNETNSNSNVTRGLSNDKIPVTADQIHDGNAQQMFMNLQDEVRRASNEPIEISPDNN